MNGVFGRYKKKTGEGWKTSKWFYWHCLHYFWLHLKDQNVLSFALFAGGKALQVILLTPNPLLRNRNERTPSRESANYKDSNTTLHKSSISGNSIIENCRTSDTGIIEIIITLKYTMPILFFHRVQLSVNPYILIFWMPLSKFGIWIKHPI